MRLFQRSTRRLTLIEAGERFLQSVAGGLEDIQNTIAGVSADAGQASGVLRVSVSPGFGVDQKCRCSGASMRPFPPSASLRTGPAA